MKNLTEFFVQMVRYSLGLLAAYAVSAIILIISAVFASAVFTGGHTVNETTSIIVGNILLGTIGFSAVTVATLFTDRRSRHISAWFYVMVGAALFTHHANDAYIMGRGYQGPDLAATIRSLIPLLIGGVIAASRFSLNRASQADESPQNKSGEGTA